MKNDILVGIDLGSTNVKTVFFNSAGCVLAYEADGYSIHLLKPGWVEYDPDDWWYSTKKTIKTCISKTNIDPGRIAGIGISSLGCCPVPMDEDGKIIYNAIPWSDQRAQEEVDFLIRNCKEMMIASSSNYPATLNAMPHLLWIKNHEPEIYNKLFKYTEPSGFIIQRLTGNFILDYAAASFIEFGIDIEKLEYNKNLIAAMGLDLEKFPKLISNTDMAGTVNKKAASETGLPEGIPVYCGGNDVPAGAIGGGAIRPGQAFLYTGSGSNTTVVTDQLAGLENTASGVIGDSINPYEFMSAEAQKTEAGSGGLIFLPFLFGHFHPELNPYAKGVFFGISPATTRPQLIRSVMEGRVFDNYQSFKVIMDLNIDIDEIIFVGGPSNSDLWCQVLSDVTNRKVITKHIPEASTLGDAITAGVGVGMFSNFEDVVDNVIKVKKVYAPDEKNHRLYEELYDLYIQIYSDSLENFENLANMREKHNILK